MKKVWFVILIIMALIGGAIIYVALSDSSMSSTFRQGTQDNQEQTDDNQPTQSGTTAGDGEYVDYSEEAVANADDRKWLFFHAPWCPQCRALESDIQSSGVPQGITIFKVDYDSATNLKQRYAVTIQTTIIEVNSDGNEIARFVAYDDPSVDAVVNALGE